MDVAGGGGFHAVAPGADERCEHEVAVGEALRRGTAYANAGPPRGFGAFGSSGDVGEAAETVREVSWKAQRKALGPGAALPDH